MRGSVCRLQNAVVALVLLIVLAAALFRFIIVGRSSSCDDLTRRHAELLKLYEVTTKSRHAKVTALTATQAELRVLQGNLRASQEAEESERATAKGFEEDLAAAEAKLTMAEKRESQLTAQLQTERAATARARAEFEAELQLRNKFESKHASLAAELDARHAVWAREGRSRKGPLQPQEAASGGGSGGNGGAVIAKRAPGSPVKDLYREKCAVEGNCALRDAFLELAGFEHKAKRRMKYIAFRNAATAIARSQEPIMSGEMAVRLDGISQRSATKINEFLQGGTIAQLEEYRSGAGSGASRNKPMNKRRRHKQRR